MRAPIQLLEPRPARIVPQVIFNLLRDLQVVLIVPPVTPPPSLVLLRSVLQDVLPESSLPLAQARAPTASLELIKQHLRSRVA